MESDLAVPDPGRALALLGGLDVVVAGIVVDGGVVIAGAEFLFKDNPIPAGWKSRVGNLLDFRSSRWMEICG